MTNIVKEDGVSMVGGSPVIPTNNVGDGLIAGLGVGKDGEPGVDKRRKRKVIPFKTMFRRKLPKSE